MIKIAFLYCLNMLKNIYNTPVLTGLDARGTPDYGSAIP
jgi:hypothetical protein